MNNLNNLNTLNYFSKQPIDSIYYAGTGASLDLNFARNKSLMDRISGNNLVTFTRASSGTFVNSNGVLQSAPVNFIRNNTMVGAVAGTPGTLPTNWTYAVPGSGLTSSITGVGVENGISYIDFRVTGTSTSTTAIAIGLDNAAALTGQAWTSSAYFKLAAGSVSGITSWNLLIGESTSAGGFVAGADYPVAAPTSTLIRSAVTRTLSGGASVALVNTAVRVFCTNGAAIDFTLRIGMPQLEQGSSATEIIRTTGTINSAPRFDHNPTTGESLGLLIEEQRTNLLLRSGEFDNASWGKNNSSITANTVAAPNGTVSADSLIETSTSAEHSVSQSFTAVSGNAYTLSVFVKSLSGNRAVKLRFTTAAWIGSINTQVDFNLTTGIGTTITGSPTFTSQAFPGGWWRFSMTATSTANGTPGASVHLIESTGSSISYTGDGTSGIYIWGAQLEAGAFPTSYIPTTTATATRSADVASITGANFSSWYNNAAWTLFFAGNTASQSAVIGGIRPASDAFGDGPYLARSVSNYGFFKSDLSAFISSSPSNFTVAAALEANNAGLSLNGSTANTDLACAVTTSPTSLSIGGRTWSGAGSELNGTIRRITYFPQRISNANLQRITQ